MKSFRFSLDPALQWRETKSEQEDEKLSRLLAELKRLELLALENEQARITASTSQFEAGHIPGSDVRALGTYLLGLEAQAAVLRGEIAKCKQRIERQQAACLVARRDVKLLDLLKAKQHKAWQYEVNRELETAAADNYLARIAREGAS